MKVLNGSNFETVGAISTMNILGQYFALKNPWVLYFNNNYLRVGCYCRHTHTHTDINFPLTSIMLVIYNKPLLASKYNVLVHESPVKYNLSK